MSVIEQNVIMELTTRRVKHYFALIHSENQDVRVDYCTEYLCSWKKVFEKEGKWEALSAAEQMMILSAMYEEVSDKVNGKDV